MTLQTSQAKNYSKGLFRNTQEFQIPSGINSPKISTSLNVPKHGGMRSVGSILTSTNLPRQQRTERISKKSSRRPSIYFLMRKFKKLHQKTRDSEISWTRSRNIICQLLKFYNITDITVSNSKIYDRYFIKLSIWYKIIKSTSNCWTKFL